MLSRTRKEIRALQNFYKEAGLCGEFENFYDQNNATQYSTKRDRVLLKKKVKGENSQQIEAKTTADKQQQLELSDENNKECILPFSTPTISTKQSELPLPLSKMINKISILQVNENKNVQGCYGHTTAIFRRPIIQGNYYLQFKLLKPNLGEGRAKIKNPPALRVGLCPIKYSKNIPLGQELSLGYKVSTGKLVFQGQEHEATKGAQENDVIGLCMSFSPPHKYQNEEKLWEDSQIKILVNGEEATKSSKLHQIFYCPAFSLYNYMSVEVRTYKSSFEFCPQGYLAYGDIFNQAIAYQELLDTPSFAFLKLESK